MSYQSTQPASRVTVAACCLVFVLVTATCHAALPDAVQPVPASDEAQAEQVRANADVEAAYDELLGRMLTPTAEIKLGPGRANQERLLHRSSTYMLSTTIRSIWTGIVEYVFPPHGFFRRSDPLARIYDPRLLADLERARAQMAAEDVSPLTIAAAIRRRASEPALPAAAESTPATPNVAAPEQHSAPRVEQMSTPYRTPTTDSPAAIPDPVTVPDFDFKANQSELDQLREQAQLTATAIPEAIKQCRSAQTDLSAAQEELADRHRLLEQGVLAEQGLRPAEARLAETRAAYQRAEAMLDEAQAGYDRIAERIMKLEAEANAAHAAIRTAREEQARRVGAIARHEEKREADRRAAQEAAANPPDVRLQRREPTPVAQPPNATTVAPAADDGLATNDEPVRVYHTPNEMRELAAPRWEELNAEMPGLISEVLVQEGETVDAGEELLRVANLQLASVTARIDAGDLRHFTVGRSITIAFNDYDDAIFAGWVDAAEPVKGTGEADVKLLLVCQSGRFADDPYLALRWMTLEAGVGADKVDSKSLQPALCAPAGAEAEVRLAQMFPTIAPGNLYAERATKPSQRVNDRFTGRLQLQPMERLVATGEGSSEGADRLAALCEWRKTYIDGMATTLLDDGTCISYPANGDVSAAVRLMLEGRVNHRPNLCAATMREALGWGLGDAHQWATRLPRVGYIAREDGLPRPGDIIVWPFTYGANRSQHIGFAVRQGRKLMLLSNLSGTLGTTEILGGYIAFYKPSDQALPDA